MQGYQWLGHNRENKKGGGIGFLIRNDIKKLFEEHEVPNSNDTEIKWIKIKGKTNIALSVIYGKQESAKKEEAEQQFQELTTHTNMLQQTHRVIILGDLNAKIEITQPDHQQKQSRNGKMLAKYVNDTDMVNANTHKNHQDSWKRVNTNNSQEKSIIDYIIVSKSLEPSIIESSTDNNNLYTIKGANQTDHNVITATIKTTIEQTTQKQTKWKKGTPEEWKKINTEIQSIWQQTGKNGKNIDTLQHTIRQYLKHNMGSCNYLKNKPNTQNHQPTNKASKARKQKTQKEFQ